MERGALPLFQKILKKNQKKVDRCGLSRYNNYRRRKVCDRKKNEKTFFLTNTVLSVKIEKLAANEGA